MSIRHVEDLRKIRPLVAFIIERFPDIFTKDFRPNIKPIPAAIVLNRPMMNLNTSFNDSFENIPIPNNKSSTNKNIPNLLIPSPTNEAYTVLLESLPSARSSVNINSSEWKVSFNEYFIKFSYLFVRLI